MQVNKLIAHGVTIYGTFNTNLHSSLTETNMLRDLKKTLLILRINSVFTKHLLRTSINQGPRITYVIHY